MKYGLKKSVIQAIVDIIQKYEGVEKVILYGSRAKGSFQPASDIDLVLIGERLTLSNQFSIENELDDLLLPYKIDLALWHHIDNPELLDHIRRIGVVIWEWASEVVQ